MMLGIGVWYLGFGTRWIAWYHGGDDEQKVKKSGLHVVTGIQVRLCVRLKLTIDRTHRVIDDSDASHRNGPPKQKRLGLWKPSPRLARSRYTRPPTQTV
jgi:hypothetical protein